MVNVVTLHGDLVIGSEKQKSPVVVVVATRAPARVPIDFRVGNSDATTGCVACDNVLATDQRGFHVVDPHEISAGERDGITTPDVLWVELCDVNVLDDDVFCVVGDAQAFATDDAFGAFTNERFVGREVDGFDGGVVVGYADAGVGALCALERVSISWRG